MRLIEPSCTLLIMVRVCGLCIHQITIYDTSHQQALESHDARGLSVCACLCAALAALRPVSQESGVRAQSATTSGVCMGVTCVRLCDTLYCRHC
jgi:hypothetical protein